MHSCNCFYENATAKRAIPKSTTATLLILYSLADDSARACLLTCIPAEKDTSQALFHVPPCLGRDVPDRVQGFESQFWKRSTRGIGGTRAGRRGNAPLILEGRTGRLEVPGRFVLVHGECSEREVGVIRVWKIARPGSALDRRAEAYHPFAHLENHPWPCQTLRWVTARPVVPGY